MYTVFLADDEIWVSMGLKKMIGRSGTAFQVIGEASDGVTAFEEIRRLRPDLLLADIRMPGLNGIELLKKIRENGLDTRVILVSGYAEFSYAQEAVRLGASDYLLKPVEEEELRNVLKKTEEELGGKDGAEGSVPGSPPTVLDRVIREIQERYTENITLSGLAEKYHLSPARLSGLLKNRLGLTFSEYLSAKRIQHAKELMRDESLSTAAIAEMCGYNDYFYFTKVFKKVAGMSPGKYRTKLSDRE